MDFRLLIRTYLKHTLQRERTALETMAGLPRLELEDLRQQIESSEDADWLYDAAEDARQVAATLFDLHLVCVYHWAENGLKLLLARLPGYTLAKATRLDQDEIARAFKSVGADLACLQGYEEIVGVLRLCANSWKHNVGRASAGLVQELGLDAKAGPYSGLLMCDPIRHAIARRLKVTAQQDDHDAICMAAVRIVYEFLVAAVEAAPIEDRLPTKA
jgi:hypothetical protein